MLLPRDQRGRPPDPYDLDRRLRHVVAQRAHQERYSYWPPHAAPTPPLARLPRPRPRSALLAYAAGASSPGWQSNLPQGHSVNWDAAATLLDAADWSGGALHPARDRERQGKPEPETVAAEVITTTTTTRPSHGASTGTGVRIRRLPPPPPPPLLADGDIRYWDDSNEEGDHQHITSKHGHGHGHGSSSSSGGAHDPAKRRSRTLRQRVSLLLGREHALSSVVDGGGSGHGYSGDAHNDDGQGGGGRDMGAGSAHGHWHGHSHGRRASLLGLLTRPLGGA